MTPMIKFFKTAGAVIALILLMTFIAGISGMFLKLLWTVFYWGWTLIF